MGFKITDGLAPAWFTPGGQEGDPNPSRFLIRPMNGQEYLNLLHHGDQVELPDGEVGFQTSDSGRELMLKQVVDWQNVFNEAGEPLPFSWIKLKSLPPQALSDISQEVIRVSMASQEQAKNSSSQSKSSTPDPSLTAPTADGENTVIPVTPRQ